MVTEEQVTAADLYAGLMEEAKARLAVLRAMIDGTMAADGEPLSAPILREFGCLQLRMLCEVVALSCLIAHGDIKATQPNNLRKMWKADRIIAELEKLHADFYPRPVHLIVREGPLGEPSLAVDPNKAGGITRDELMSLYERSGAYLHRGSVEKMISSAPSGFDRLIGSDIMAIATSANKFAALLETHMISSADRRRYFLCWLSDSRNQGNVSVVLANR